MESITPLLRSYVSQFLLKKAQPKFFGLIPKDLCSCFQSLIQMFLLCCVLVFRRIPLNTTFILVKLMWKVFPKPVLLLHTPGPLHILFPQPSPSSSLLLPAFSSPTDLLTWETKAELDSKFRRCITGDGAKRCIAVLLIGGKVNIKIMSRPSFPLHITVWPLLCQYTSSANIFSLQS